MCHVSLIHRKEMGEPSILQLEAQTNCLLWQIYEGNLLHHHQTNCLLLSHFNCSYLVILIPGKTTKGWLPRFPQKSPKDPKFRTWDIFEGFQKRVWMVGRPDAGFAVWFALSPVSVADWSPIHDNALMPPPLLSCNLHCKLCSAAVYLYTAALRSHNTTLQEHCNNLQSTTMPHLLSCADAVVLPQ